MNCWHCKTKLIWGADHDSEDGDWSIETTLNCPKCNSMVMVYYPRSDDD
jgi:DNA-directed RNA polymerase subunit RPC12/RpoP